MDQITQKRERGGERESQASQRGGGERQTEREDHTIGNILRMQLHRDDNVLFAGYKLPHPLKYKIIVRIHTTSQSSPMQAYNQAINDLDKELDHLKNAFEVWHSCDSVC